MISTLNNLNLRSKTDQIISTALMSIYLILMIQYFILSFFALSGTYMQLIIQNASKIIVGILYVIALPKTFKRRPMLFITTFIFALIIYILQYLIFPSNRELLESAIFNVFFISLPAFIYTLNLKDYNIFKSTMIKVGNLVFIIGILYSSLILVGVISSHEHYMSFSYYMLLPAILYLDRMIDKFTIKYLLLTSISFIIILALGARGPFIGIFLFIFLKNLKKIQKINFRNILFYSLIGLFFVTFLLFYEYILTSLDMFLKNFGLHSRSIELVLNGNVTTNTRTQIYYTALESLMNKPLFGWGLMGDRIAVGRMDYIHNFFLEILVSFGVILGSLLITSFVFVLVLSLIQQKRLSYDILIIWLSIGFTHLMVSGSYLIDFRFWIFFGILIKSLDTKKFISSNNNYY